MTDRSEESRETGRETNRRGFLTAGVAAFVAGLLGKKAIAATSKPKPSKPASDLVTDGEILKTHVRKGQPPIEPLATMILFERSDENNTGGTREILSLEHEEKGSTSWPWTIYSHLTTHHTTGDACAFYARMTKIGPGWSCGIHTEAFAHNRMVALGMNVEVTNYYPGPEPSLVIGINIQAHGPHQCQYGIQVADANDGHFEKGIGLNGKGAVGLDLGGEYQIGINTHKNSIRLGEGACIELDGKGAVKMRYVKGRIEFINGDKCVGHIDMSDEDHKL